LSFLDTILGFAQTIVNPAAVGTGIGAGLVASVLAPGIPEAQLPGALLAGQVTQAGQAVGAIEQGQAIRQLQGKNRVQTTIQTINPQGQVIRQQVVQGRPFLMQKDFTIAKRVIKLAAQAAARIPKKRVQEGIGAQITRAVKQKVLSNVVNGHNGNGGRSITTVDTE